MYSRLEDILRNQEANYMLPFYWQHGDHYETIPEEVERIYQSGARAFCVESRPHKDFGGPTWWRDMDLILAEAKKRGMKVWILDDDHFPTGHAAGHIEKYHPELRRWQLVEQHVDVMGPLKDAVLLMGDPEEETELLSVYAYPRSQEGEACDARPICLTEQVKGSFLHVTLPEGCWRVFIFRKSRRGSANSNYIDMLSEESVRVLIDAVYEPHYEHYKEYFGTTIAGFFSDEPTLGADWAEAHSEDYGMYNRRVGMPGLALPWNDRIVAMMSGKLGYDAAPFLSALWFDLEGKTAEIRYAYMDCVTKLYRDCFTRQLGDWCEAHNVQYIGHVIEDMNAHARLGSSGGHYFRSLDGQHMSGIDVVLHQLIPGMSDYIHTCSAFGNNADPEFFDYVLAKLGSSFAHIGTQMEGRAMCEVFGAYGWAEGTPVMKWLLDHLLVRGINHFVPHAFSPAFPDPDCPPHFGANNVDPQFEGFSKLMDYGNKAAHLLYGGTHVADAAILYHGDAEWMNRIGDAMLTQVPAKILYDAHIDFDILPVDCFIDDSGSRVFPAKAENGKLVVGKQQYQYLVIPEAKVLPAAFEEAVEELRNAGVPVFRLGVDCEKQELLSVVQERFEQDIRMEGNTSKVRCCHYSADGAEIYMFVNESVTESVCTAAELRGIGNAYGTMLDLLNDESAAVEIREGKVALDLAPYQSVLLVIEEEKSELAEKKNWVKVCPAQLTFKVETAEYTAMEEYKEYADGITSDELFSISGMEHMPDFSGRIRYTTAFEKTELPFVEETGIDLGEVGQTSHLWCNGQDMGVRVCPPYRYDLTKALREGKNELVIEVSNTLANAIKDGLSQKLVIPASGLLGKINWIKRSESTIK